MIIALEWTFHDHEPERLIVDTDKLEYSDAYLKSCGITDPADVAVHREYIATLKRELESDEDDITINGEEQSDNGVSQWYIPPSAKIKKQDKGKITIDAHKSLCVFWDC